MQNICYLANTLKRWGIQLVIGNFHEPTAGSQFFRWLYQSFSSRHIYNIDTLIKPAGVRVTENLFQFYLMTRTTSYSQGINSQGVNFIDIYRRNVTERSLYSHHDLIFTPQGRSFDPNRFMYAPDGDAPLPPLQEEHQTINCSHDGYEEADWMDVLCYYYATPKEKRLQFFYSPKQIQWRIEISQGVLLKLP